MKKRLIFTLIASIFILQILILNPVNAEVYPGSTWQTKTPVEMGLDVNRLNELRDYIGGNGVVIRDGYLVYSWGNTAQRNDIASAVKPIYSHFLFEAVDSGLLTSIDQRINTFETCVNNINSNLNFKDRAITFKQMANQISCYGVRENPGTCFDYNDYNMALFFDTLFLRVYGATYSNVDSNVLDPRLGNILQFQDNPTFLGTGQNFQMGRINISVRDFARFGLLYLRNGMWNSQQLIRQQDAVMAVSSPLSLSIPRTTAVVAQMCPGQRSIGSTAIPDDQTDHNGGYSFAWWVNGINRAGSRNWPRAPLDTYAALGFGATRSLVVMPGLDIVVAWNNPYRSSNVFVDRAFDYINRSAVIRNVNSEQTNTHYLKDKNGNYQFFIGGYPFYPASPFSPDGSAGDINWAENLEYSRLHGYNMVRGLGSGDGWVEPPIDDDYPFRRSNVCCAFDGGNKFDLSQLNEAFFQDIDLALTAAESKGLTVISEFFGVSGPFGCNPGSSCFTNFSNNFWHSRNSIGGANWVDKTQARQDFFNPRGSLHAVQERALNRYLESVCDHPNVIHQPVNEIHQYTGMENADEFEDWIRDKIRSTMYCGPNAVVLLNNEVSTNFGIDRSGYQGITIHAPHRGNGAFPSGFSVNQMVSTMSSLYGRNKFIGFDVDVGKIPLIDDYRKGAWTALTTGSGMFIVLYYQHRDVTQSPRRGVVDADLPHVANFIQTKQIKPWEMDPTRTSLVRSGTATLLVKESSKTILAYLRNGGTVQLDLGQFQGSLNVEWYNPREGTIDRTATISGGNVLSFTPPAQTTSDWVLFISQSTQQRCIDNTPYNQCSNTQPLFCFNNGTLGNNCQQCRCPSQQTCQPNGICSGSPNQAPTATITLPTQTIFTVNTTINYAGIGTDPDGTIVSYSWTLDIIGDGQQPFNIGNQQSGTYTPILLVNNLSTTYRLTLTVTDNDGAPGTNFKELTIVPSQQNCVLTSAQWDRTLATEGILVNLIVNGNNCNGKLVNFVVWEDDTANPDDPVQVNPQSVAFNNNVATATWIAEFQEDCGGVCNPPEYIFITSLNDNSNVNIQSSNQLIVNRGTENQPPNVSIVSPDINSEAISFETNMPTSAYIEYGLTNSYGNRESSVTIGTAHTIFLRDLEQGRQYHYKITVTDVNGIVISTQDRVFTVISSTQQCSDNTPYNQCSNTQPLFCFNNGTLGNNCQQCRCPSQQTCQPNGICSGSPNQAPTATITLPTQTTFTVNTTINYAGIGTDPEEGNLPPSSLCWNYDIIGDQQGFINLGCRSSGTFTPVQSGTYILKLVATDTQGLSDSKNKTLTINPGPTQTCQQQSGICCQTGQTCNGQTVASNNCNTICCVGMCQASTGTLSGGVALSGFWEGWRARHAIGVKFFNGPNNEYGMMGFNTYAVRRLDIGRRGWLEFDVRIEGPRPNDGKGGQHLFSVTSQAACQAGPCDPATGQNLNGWLRIDNGAAENNIVNGIYNNHGNGTLNGVRNANQQTLNAWRQWAHIRLEWEQTANNIRVKLNGRESTVSISPTSRDTGILLIVGNMDKYSGHPAPGYENLCSDANCAAGVCHCSNPDGTPMASCSTCRCSAGLDPCGMIDQVWYKNFRWGRL